MPFRALGVNIKEPKDGSTFTKGTEVFFYAKVLPDRDYRITDLTDITWESSIDEKIFTEPDDQDFDNIAVDSIFSKADLSLGTHTITCMATDVDGNQDYDSITITIA